MSTASAQAFLLKLCADLKKEEFPITKGKNMHCWIDIFAKFVTDPIDDPDPTATDAEKVKNPYFVYIPGKGETFPVSTPAKFNEYIKEWLFETQIGKTE